MEEEEKKGHRLKQDQASNNRRNIPDQTSKDLCQNQTQYNKVDEKPNKYLSSFCTFSSLITF